MMMMTVLPHSSPLCFSPLTVPLGRGTTAGSTLRTIAATRREVRSGADATSHILRHNSTHLLLSPHTFYSLPYLTLAGKIGRRYPPPLRRCLARVASGEWQGREGRAHEQQGRAHEQHEGRAHGAAGEAADDGSPAGAASSVVVSIGNMSMRQVREASTTFARLISRVSPPRLPRLSHSSSSEMPSMPQ